MRNCLKNGKFILCIILAILTAIMLPIEVFAQVAPKHNPSAIVKFDSLAESEDIGEIVTELKERRDEYTKHFRMEDGTMMAVTCNFYFKNKKSDYVAKKALLLGGYIYEKGYIISFYTFIFPVYSFYCFVLFFS